MAIVIKATVIIRAVIYGLVVPVDCPDLNPIQSVLEQLEHALLVFITYSEIMKKLPLSVKKAHGIISGYTVKSTVFRQFKKFPKWSTPDTDN